MTSKLPSQMRAAQWSSSASGIENSMKVVDVPLPKNFSALPSGYTLVKMDCVTLNPVDFKFAETPIIGRFITRTPGSDYAGEVVQSTFADIKTGDKVFGKIDPPTFGALAEYALVKTRDNVIHIPKGLSSGDAASLGVCGLTAYQSIVPFVQKGDHVLINGGSGGVGTYGIQIAKTIGCKVTAICSGPNVQLCKDLGADHVFDYRAEDVILQLVKAKMQYDLIFDAVGTPELYYNAHHYSGPKGLFNTVAINPTSFQSIRETALMFLLPRLFGGGSRRIGFIGAKSDRKTYEQLAQWAAEGKIKAHVDREYSFTEVAEAFAKLKTSRTRGKLIVKVQS